MAQTKGVINGEKLIIYADGKPIEVTTGHLVLDGRYESCTEDMGEHTFTFEAYKMPEIGENEYTKRLIWNNIQSMPRKKKKRVMTLLRKGYTMNVQFK